MKGPLATEGAALVYTSLLVMVLVAVMLATTSQMALRSRASSQEQDRLLVAQYAAEAGVARGQNQLAAVRNSVAAIQLAQTLSDSVLRDKLARFCGVGVGELPPFSQVVPATPLTLCRASAAGGAAAQLAEWTAGNMPAGWTASQWDALFGAGYALADGQSGDATVKVSVGLQAVDVVQTAPSTLRLRMQVRALQATGEVGGARRVLNASSNGLFVLTFARPNFASYAQFRDRTTSATGGGSLYFGAGEVFNGPVHTNETLRLSGNATLGPPTFNGRLSTAGSATDYQGLPCTRAVIDAGTCAVMFPGGRAPVYNTGTIALPANNNNQLRAALGLGDVGNTAALTGSELQAALGLPGAVPNGVYSSRATTPNDFMGGIYVQGAATVRLSTTDTPARQVIEIIQSATNTRTRFEEGANGTWTRQRYTGTTLTSSTSMGGAFNGMLYVSGAVELQGDGTAAPDVGVNSALTLAMTGGDMRLKNSVTYAESPLGNAQAKNVLGLFNATGSVLLDGPQNEPMNVHATILASATGKGFGTVNASTSRGSPQPTVNLIGGVIESQSQTVSSGGGGYKRNYQYDPRFATGYAPPYFPFQQQWTTTTSARFDTGLQRQGR